MNGSQAGAVGTSRVTAALASLRSPGLDRMLAAVPMRLGMSPNQVTLLGLLALAGAAYQFLIADYIIATVFIALNGLCDVTDGSLARCSGRSTRFGRLLDRVADKVSDFTILSLYPMMSLVPLPLALYVIGTMMIATVISANIEAIFRVSASDALSLRLLRFLLILTLTPLQQFMALFVLLALITTLSVAGRLRTALRLAGP